MTNFGKTISIIIIIIIAVVVIGVLSRKPAVAPIEQPTTTEQSETTNTSVNASVQTDDASIDADLKTVDTQLDSMSADASASAATQ